MTTITNINGIELSNCACGDWLSHWKWFSHQDPSFCAHKNCTGTDLEGALVQKGEGADKAWYIVPLCSTHCRHKGTLEIADGYRLVSADTKATCDRVIGDNQPQLQEAISKQTRFWINTLLITWPKPDAPKTIWKPTPVTKNQL